MKQHLYAYPELKNQALFLHDSDIVLTRPINFREMLKDDIWYLSDTNSYINHSYIISKGEHVYNDMCDIFGIDKLIPKLMNSNSGGAQYLTKNTDYDFWNKVELDSVKLYHHFIKTENLHVKKNETDYPIQKWTAGMWSLLWNAWIFGHETKVDSRLNFGWSTNLYSDVENNSILHNAGVMSSNDGLFYKSDYMNKSPYGENLNIDKAKASYFYWTQVQEASKKSPLYNSNDKISFICTTYRRATCVERIIAQYQAQTYKNKELIIFNTDTDYPIELSFYDDSIIVVNNNEDYINKLPYTNRGDICRDAVTHATGDYFMLADDDDIYLPWHMQQAYDGINKNGKDAWKPEKSFYADHAGKIILTSNVMEASIIVKMGRIREIGFRNDKTGLEGLSWYIKLRDENNLIENEKEYIPSYSFNWSDPQEIGGHKQSGSIDQLNNFEIHKLNCSDYAKKPLEPLNKFDLDKVYKPYYNYILEHKHDFNLNLFEKYMYDIPNMKNFEKYKIDNALILTSCNRVDQICLALSVNSRVINHPFTLIVVDSSTPNLDANDAITMHIGDDPYNLINDKNYNPNWQLIEEHIKTLPNIKEYRVIHQSPRQEKQVGEAELMSLGITSASMLGCKYGIKLTGVCHLKRNPFDDKLGDESVYTWKRTVFPEKSTRVVMFKPDQFAPLLAQQGWSEWVDTYDVIERKLEKIINKNLSDDKIKHFNLDEKDIIVDEGIGRNDYREIITNNLIIHNLLDCDDKYIKSFLEGNIW
jgi:hypothetical protein